MLIKRNEGFCYARQRSGTIYMARQRVELLLNGVKTENTELIACTSIISKNYASDFTGASSHLLAQVAQLHGEIQLEAQRYKQRI